MCQVRVCERGRAGAPGFSSQVVAGLRNEACHVQTCSRAALVGGGSREHRVSSGLSVVSLAAEGCRVLLSSEPYLGWRCWNLVFS